MMSPILERPHVLHEFARARVLLGFDFDGTLAPIVDTPDEARMRRSTRALFIEVARRYPCAVVSGRERADLAARVEGVPLVEIVGNHGIEPFGRAAAFTGACTRWTTTLERSLAATAGIVIENKGPSLSIHYRAAPDVDEARRAIEDAVRALDGELRIVPGKCVVNVLPRDAPHKGTALQQLLSSLGLDRAIYVGDDVTDEDVFAGADPTRLLTIRVGHDPSSAASYYLDAQPAIDRLLAALLALS